MKGKLAMAAYVCFGAVPFVNYNSGVGEGILTIMRKKCFYDCRIIKYELSSLRMQQSTSTSDRSGEHRACKQARRRRVFRGTRMPLNPAFNLMN